MGTILFLFFFSRSIQYSCLYIYILKKPIFCSCSNFLFVCCVVLYNIFESKLRGRETPREDHTKGKREAERFLGKTIPRVSWEAEGVLGKTIPRVSWEAEGLLGRTIPRKWRGRGTPREDYTKGKRRGRGTPREDHTKGKRRGRGIPRENHTKGKLRGRGTPREDHTKGKLRGRGTPREDHTKGKRRGRGILGFYHIFKIYLLLLYTTRINPHYALLTVPMHTTMSTTNNQNIPCWLYPCKVSYSLLQRIVQENTTKDVSVEDQLWLPLDLVWPWERTSQTKQLN